MAFIGADRRHSWSLIMQPGYEPNSGSMHTRRWIFYTLTLSVNRSFLCSKFASLLKNQVL